MAIRDYMPPVQTEADILRAQKKAMGEYGVQAGIGALAGLGQIGLSFIDTPQDTANKAEIERLQKLRAKGDLGLSGEEKQHYEHAIMDPVRAMAAEQGRREEARLAASGRGSAADVVRAQREERRAVTDAAARAGTQIEGANLQRAAEQRQELNERLATESERAKSRIGLAAQTLVGLAPNVGRVLAANAQKSDMTDGQILAMMAATNKDGVPVYPGLQGLSLADARVLLSKGDAKTLFAAPGAVPTTAPSNIEPQKG